MTFHIGQKVVCVNASAATALQVGKIYVIISLVGKYFGSPKYITIDNGGDVKDGGWLASRFRPIVERKTDIAVFTEILRKATKKIPALIGNESNEI